MRLSTGRWVSGDDFFDRESELRVLKARVCDGNHVLLTGQRRMGKTRKDGFRFPSRLLRDWWAARFRDHHSPLASRRRKNRSSGEVR